MNIQDKVKTQEASTFPEVWIQASIWRKKKPLRGLMLKVNFLEFSLAREF